MQRDEQFSQTVEAISIIDKVTYRGGAAVLVRRLMSEAWPGCFSQISVHVEIIR